MSATSALSPAPQIAQIQSLQIFEVSQANSEGQTPLSVATQNQQEPCIQILKVGQKKMLKIEKRIPKRPLKKGNHPKKSVVGTVEFT